MEPSKPGDRLYHFHGGLRLRHHKKVACESPIEPLPLPERLYVPLKQHQGPAAVPVVGAGDRVLKGQLLAGGDEPRTVPVHAPTSGTVIAIRDWPAAWPPGLEAPCIEIEPDGEDRWTDRQPLADPDRLIEHLNELGLSGLGGAMFPTATKLRGDWPAIHTLILNGAECEPWIACDEMLMRERGSAILEGGCLLARAIGAGRVVVAIEDQMGTVARRLEVAREKLECEVEIRIVKVTTIYPEGSERQLIRVITGRDVPHDGLPQDLGVVCVNVATACAARDAVLEGTPVIERVVTVTGPGVKRPKNVRALIGTPVEAFLEAAGGCTDDIDRLILGGPLSGLPLASPQIPVTKGSNCILALTETNVRHEQPPMPCINCGECVRVCPAVLLPQLLFKHIAADDYEGAEELDLWDCIECGCCAQVCPSHIPLIDYYRHGKGELTRRGIESARAEQARLRHEQRSRRLEAENAARRARREAREQALADPDKAKDAVAEAIRRAKKKISGPSSSSRP